tara:strand:+ start:79 stop:1383 length:1305 start_codon:yes stop_codon:yes gene_type:complete
MSQNYDVLVIGSGAGGMSAAARLAKENYKVLVVEALERIGGRASTRDVDGFKINTGGFAIERDGMVAITREEIGLPLHLFVPEIETVLLWGDKQLKMSAGLVSVARNVAPRIIKLLTKVIPPIRPKQDELLIDWVSRLTKNKKIHQLIDNVSCAFFAATMNDIKADVFFHYISEGSSFKKIGFVPGGSIEIWKPMAEFIQQKEGEVWVNARASKLTFAEDGTVNGAVINKNGNEVSISCKAVVSNAGPLATAQIAGSENLPKGYLEEVRKKTDPGGIITLHFASQKDICSFPGLAVGALTPQLTYAANFSAPELGRCPEGWNLYIAACSPKPSARGEFDVEREVELLKQDVRTVFKGFDEHAKILDVDVTAGLEWPAQRAITGNDLPMDTPIANLWNVGDGVKPWGEAGTATCAETGRLVVNQILKKYPLSSLK